MIGCKKTALVFLLGAGMLLSSISANAQTREFNGGNYIACVSEDLFEQSITAIMDEDERAIDYLLNNGCISPRAGIPVSILDTTWDGAVQVRAYLGENTMEFWTVRDAVSETDE